MHLYNWLDQYSSSSRLKAYCVKTNRTAVDITTTSISQEELIWEAGYINIT